MKSGIYKICNTINSKFYIGSSINLDRRKNEHFRNLKNQTHTNNHLQSSWNKYGKENFEFEILETCEIENLISKEQHYIDELKPEYNICRTAGSTLGFKPSSEQILKASLKRKGKKRSEETRKKMSDWQFGRKFSLESRQKMSSSAKNKPNMNALIERMKNRDAKGSKNGRAKLDEDQVKLIKLDISKGFRAKDIANKYNVSKNIIYYIKSGETWSHVKI